MKRNLHEQLNELRSEFNQVKFCHLVRNLKEDIFHNPKLKNNEIYINKMFN